MAGAAVQFKEGNGSASTTTVASGTLASDVTAGNYLWVVVTGSDATTRTITKNSGTATISAFTSHGTIQAPTILDEMEHWTCQVTGTGTIDILCTYGAARTERVIAVVEVSGVNAIDGSDEQTDTGSNPTTTCTVNVTTQPAFGLMMLCNYQGAGSGIGSGWTSYQASFATATIGEGVIQTKAISATGNTTGNFTNAGLDRNSAVMIVFTDGGAAAGAKQLMMTGAG